MEEERRRQLAATSSSDTNRAQRTFKISSRNQSDFYQLYFWAKQLKKMESPVTSQIAYEMEERADRLELSDTERTQLMNLIE